MDQASRMNADEAHDFACLVDADFLASLSSDIDVSSIIAHFQIDTSQDARGPEPTQAVSVERIDRDGQPSQPADSWTDAAWQTHRQNPAAPPPGPPSYEAATVNQHINQLRITANH